MKENESNVGYDNNNPNKNKKLNKIRKNKRKIYYNE